tara:strand:+ start:112 stop:771 length:660 start_codon:yes stop_codon:yes gene_type:complete
MIKLPNKKNSFEFENNFYFTCNNDRISKIIIQYELFLKTQKIKGDIVECGVFKGTSLIRFGIFRDILKNKSKKLIGFDTFGKFPSAGFSKDVKQRKKFLEQSGGESISKKQLLKILNEKKISKNIELVEGDIIKTLPKYVKKHPNMKISLLNLDVDLFEPTKIILENLFPKIVKGGIIILDDYNIFPGETKAVKEYFKDKKVIIKKFDYRKSPSYIIKK